MNRKIFIIALITLILDQLTKIIISLSLTLNTSITIIPHFFYITFVTNPGAAWGILSNNLFFLILVTIIAAFIIYRFIYQFQTNYRNNLAFGLIIGGLLGNLIDRLFHGYVIDFLDFYLLNYDYPVFNLADSAIVIGVILLIFAIMKGEDHHGIKS